MRFYRFIIPYLLLCTICTNADAQSQTNDWYLSKILNDNNGLPQNSVRGLYYDAHTNFLWLATEAGLVRYNGRESKVFDNRDMPWMQSMRIHNLFATVSGKMMGVNTLGQTFSLHQSYPVSAPAANAQFTRELLYRAGNIPNIAGIATEQAVLQKEEVTFGQRSHTLWLNDTTWFVNTVQDARLIQHNRIIQRWPHPRDSLSPMLIAKKDCIYAINMQGQGYCYNLHTGQRLPTVVQSNVLASQHDTIFYKRLTNQPLLLRGKEVHEIVFYGQTISTSLIAVLPVLPSYINTIIIDNTGTYLFVATNTAGLYIYHRSPFRVYTVAGNDIYNTQYACAAIDSQHVFSSRSYLFDLQTGNAVKVPVLLTNYNTLATDATGQVWGQAIDEGGLQHTTLLRLNNKGGAASLLRLNDTLITAYRAANQRIWLSTWRCLGYVSDNHLEVVVPYNQPSHALRYLTETPDGQLLGLRDSQLVRLNLPQKRVDTLITSHWLSQARFIQADAEGYCWIATYGDGILLYALGSKKLTPLPIDDKGYLKYSHALIAEGKDFFLVPTNKGLFRLSKHNLLQMAQTGTTPLSYQYFDTNDGLLTNEFNGGCQPAYNRLPDGDLLLPSIRGLVRVKIKELTLPVAAPIWVDDIETRAGQVRFSSNLAFESNERTQTWRLNITQWNRNNSQGIFFRLDKEPEWQRLPAGETSIRLTELTGGNHTLHIRYQYGLVPAASTVQHYGFKIGRYYYETIWFWVIMLLLLVAIVYTVARLRNRTLRHKNLQLQNIIQHKTQDLSNKNEELEETLLDLKEALKSLRENSVFKDRLIGVLGHDMMVPLRFINHVADYLYDGDKDTGIATKQIKESSYKIKHTTAELLYLGEGLIQWIKLQEGRFRLIVKPIQLRQLTEEVFQVHQPLAAVKENKLVCTIPQNVECNHDAVFLKILLHNLLLNANKYTTGGIITVEASVTNELLSFWVKDTGSGMSARLVQLLNEGAAVPSQMGTNKEAGWGMGYLLMTDLLRFANGSLLVQSTPGEGTTVRFSLPLQPGSSTTTNQGNE